MTAGAPRPAVLTFRGAEVDGRIVDVRIRADVIAEVGVLAPEPGEAVIVARGGALLPGLHDHHLHLLSMAAAVESVRCGPPQVHDIEALALALRGAAGRWIRGIGYHESVAGVLDRHLLDRLVPDRPVRIQHRGGALWMLNTLALQELDLLQEFDDGRLWRRDELIRERASDDRVPDLAAVGQRLARLGVTGVTDATPDLSEDTVTLLAGGALPQRLHLLGAPTGMPLPEHVTVGPQKILLADHEPLDWHALRARIVAAHGRGRAVAVHAVTRESLIVTLALLKEVGTMPGDRIEHAAVVGRDAISLLAEVGPTVVTQPGFVVEREQQYRCDIIEPEHNDLYRYASLLDAGVAVVASSDAPFASEDPWRTIAAATDRELGPAERVAPRKVLDGLLTPLDDPSAMPRRIRIGAPADLCLLRVRLDEALSAPSADHVAVTVCRGMVQGPVRL